MRLEYFRIKNYRSVFDSGIIRVDEITALIGPNQSGKSSILQGLASISMDSSYQDFDLTQLEGVQKKVMDGDILAENIEIVWAKFLLSSDDKHEFDSIISPEVKSQEQNSDVVEEVTEETKPNGEMKKTQDGEENVEPTYLEVTKYYDESYKLNLEGKEVRFPSRTRLRSAQEEINSFINSLSSKASEEYVNKAPSDQFKPNFDEAIKVVSKVSSGVKTEQETQPFLRKLEEVTELGIDANFKKYIKSTVTEIRKIIETTYPKTPLEVSAYDYLLKRMPRTVFFRTYERMEDDVLVSELRKKPHQHKTFLNFLTLAEIRLDTLAKTDEKMIPVYLENGCGKATKLLRKAWDQEVLDVELRYLDGRLSVFTKNSKVIESLLPPSSGSEGFQWYFGFYTNFGAATKAEYKNAILLLDDPGVFLHPSGHKQLMELFEKYLEDNVTTIYSTHLPFLVPRQKLHRLRLVEKDEEGRSQVLEKFWAISDKDVLYPLRAALGVTLADSLYIGARTIIAEGPSDRILLHGMLDQFNKRGLRKISDIGNVEVLSGKGATRAKDHAILLQIERLPYVMVLDNDQEGRDSKGEAINDGIPEDKIVLLLSSASPQQKDFDIEDMFPLEIYAKAFHAVHGQATSLTEEDVLKKLKNGNEKKINNKAKRLLKDSNYDLDKPKVAREIIRIISAQEKLDKTVSDKFGELFDELNRRIQLYDERSSSGTPVKSEADEPISRPE